jgi:hypothetical protein
MVLGSKHSRNARRGQSLFTAARRPWPFFVARRRAAGAFFVRTSAWGPERGHRAVQHAAARSSARAGAGIRILLAPVLLLGAGPAGWTAGARSEQVWSVADASGTLRPCHPPRAARDTTVSLSCHVEKEMGYGHHDDARVITRA